MGFLIAEALVARHPESREGELSRLKAHLVSAAHLYGVARRLDIGAHLELGRSEEMSGGRTKKTLLVDALEAVLAAIHLDGGIDPARAFVAGHVLDAPYSGDADADTDIQPAITNFKSALQELSQSMKLPAPRYTTVRERGSGALEDVHGGSQRRQGIRFAGRRTYQEDRRATGCAQCLWPDAATGGRGCGGYGGARWVTRGSIHFGVLNAATRVENGRGPE